MPRLAFEDFEPGRVKAYAPVAVDREEILAFARAYDPQPFHLDEAAARGTMLGGLAASGWHACALLMRMIATEVLNDAASMGAPGVEEVRWRAPIRPGDVLFGRHETLEARASRSRPEMGLVRFRFRVENARGVLVLEQTNWIILGRRDAPPARPAVPHAPAPEGPLPEGGALPTVPFEDLVVGETVELGARRFGREEVVAFAAAYDPQPFHLDEAAARASHFGGLCASGWHTAAGWMAAMVAARARGEAQARAAGRIPAALGPSPGFENLSWARPVYVGDVIAYRSRVVDARPSASRPGWGLVSHRNEGVNQHGETVFAFDGRVFWEGRAARG